MKKILFIFLALPFLFSCSDDNPVEQDYTSYIIRLEGETNVFTNAKTAYFDAEGKCILIAEHGHLKPFIDTEEVVLPEFHNEIYLFYDLDGGTRLRTPFQLTKNNKNMLKITEDSRGMPITDKNVYTWPH